jgi:diadenosine tetraphosphatase ApaH/serine/threonine PP2A family protein phosphatase
MRLLLLGDVHGNLTALDAVLDDAAVAGYDRAICLGDALGYGPDPVSVLDRLRDQGVQPLLGNHELWLLGLPPGEPPRSVPEWALRWQADRLRAEQLDWLRTWPDQIVLDRPQGELLCAHGSPGDPWRYVDAPAAAGEVFGTCSAWGCCLGHRSLPGLYRSAIGPGGRWVKYQPAGERSVQLPLDSERFILNPGSVGQPRDGNPAASYALLDLDGLVAELRRVDYDVRETQRRLRAAGFPEQLAKRLELGR